MSSDELVMVACPPYPEFKEEPPDQPHSELFDCPKCKGKMWLSQKTKGVIMFSACIGKEILLGCYLCIKKLTEQDPDYFLNRKRIDL